MDWFSLLGGACLYVRLSPERLVVRDARAGRMFDQAAALAVTRAAPRRIVAVGDQAVLAAAGAQQPVDLVRPFAHPRTLMADFTGGEQLLKAAIQTVLRGRWLALSPRVLMHPVGEPVGGLTQVEIRALLKRAAIFAALQARYSRQVPLSTCATELLAGKVAAPASARSSG